MEPYRQDVTRFFLQSLHTLKKESGGQRWNAICDDTVEIAIKQAPFYFSSFQFAKEQLWQLFFHPPNTVEHSVILQFLTTQEKSPSFLFLLLQSLLDDSASTSHIKEQYAY